jgi:hypothetical protein
MELLAKKRGPLIPTKMLSTKNTFHKKPNQISWMMLKQIKNKKLGKNNKPTLRLKSNTREINT